MAFTTAKTVASMYRKNTLPSETPTRRDFLKRFSAGLGTSALALSGTVLAQDPRSTLGIALVGLGYYSTQVLAPALQECKNVSLTGIVTGTPAKAEQWKKKYNIPDRNVYNYQTYDQIADNPAIDIIYVVLPNSMHAEYVIRAAQAGKHVICEKPMALTVTECQAMIDACNDAGVSLSIGYRMQFEPHTQEVMRLGQEQVLGPVNMITAGAGYREGRAGHWKLKKAMGGGAMMDMGVYSLQAARYVLGEEPVSVTAQKFTTRPDLFKEVDETTTFQLAFPGGAVANLHTSFGFGMNYLHVNCRRGWFRLQPFQAYRGIRGESSQGPISFPQINQQATQMDEVAHGIMNNLPMRVPGEEGLRDIRVVEAIQQAIASGDKILIPGP